MSGMDKNRVWAVYKKDKVWMVDTKVDGAMIHSEHSSLTKAVYALVRQLKGVTQLTVIVENK